MTEVVWTPSEDVLEQANVVRLMRRHGFSSYRELVARSIEDPEWFWPAAVEDTGIELYEPWSEVVDLSRGPEWATWFVGGETNLAVQCVELARVALVASEKLVDGLAEAAAAALVVLVLGGHRVRSSVVVAVVFWWDSPCSRASISAR